VKLRGPDYSMREIAFDRFAQELGISCQSVVYLRLQSDAIPLTQQPEESVFQAAHLLLPEHQAGLCSPSCLLAPLQDQLNAPGADQIAVLRDCGLSCALDWPRVDLLACLCGANESGDRLYTVDHALVMIDCEQMFSTRPADLDGWGWWPDSDNAAAQENANQLAVDLCERVVELPYPTLKWCAGLPADWPLQPDRDLLRSLRLAQLAAANFLIMGPHR